MSEEEYPGYDAEAADDKVVVKTVDVFRDSRNEWRWSARAENGRVIADSAEGYVSRDWCEKVVKDLFPSAQLRPVRVDES